MDATPADIPNPSRLAGVPDDLREEGFHVYGLTETMTRAEEKDHIRGLYRRWQESGDAGPAPADRGRVESYMRQGTELARSMLSWRSSRHAVDSDEVAGAVMGMLEAYSTDI